MPSAFNELDGVSFSFGELQPVSRINNDLQSRVYHQGSISTESDAASPGETESSPFVWNTATISISPSLSSVTAAHPSFPPVERFPSSEGRLRHHFGTDSAYKKHESPVGKKFSRLHALAKSGTYWLGLAALALLVVLTSAVDPLREKLLRAGCQWARRDGASMQLSWDDDFLPRRPSRLRIQASRASEASTQSQNSFHSEIERETYDGSNSGAFDRDGLLFDGSAKKPSESEASFNSMNFSASYDPFLTFSGADSPQGPLHEVEPRPVSKNGTWQRSGAAEGREGNVSQWRRYSPAPSVYYGSSSELDADYAGERGSGNSTPITDTFTDDVPSSSTDARLELRRSHSGSDSSSSNSERQKSGLRQQRIERRRINTLPHRHRSPLTHRTHRRGSDVAEAQSKGHRKRTKVSRRSRVGAAPTTEKPTAQAASRRRWQRARRSGRNGLTKRYGRMPSVSVASQVQPSKKNRFFLPESNVASGDASGEDDDSDEQETTSTYANSAVLSSTTGTQPQRGDSASMSLPINNSDEYLDGASTSSPYQSSQSAIQPSLTTTGQGDLAMMTAARLLASRVSPDASFNLPSTQQAACSGSSNASSLPTEVLLYLVRQALEELVLSESAE
ncbi:hypothetical protein, conserved [Eimeria praecox]|uniref:Uncharacterized protein n=1 Tax=Eimeria praecox TaxID=51316 RepID=U6GPZ6_9EIME|nr:hypothetical protein, conserved [Eimeria praecox]